MKKLLVLLSLFTFVSCTIHEETNEQEKTAEVQKDYFVSSEKAKAVALSFLGETKIGHNNYKAFSNVPVPGFENKKIDKVIMVPDEKETPAVYIVTFINGGYIVVSATTKVSPILGYSFDTVFDLENVPSGLVEWLSDRVDRIHIINYIEGVEIPLNVKDDWNRYIPIGTGGEDGNGGYPAGSEVVEVKPLLSTTWGQGQGYNNHSPEINCNGIIKKGYTGCVATAVAQVMRYHEYPKNYNWVIMPNEISYYDVNTQGVNEIAKLMRQIGIYVGMKYECDGSGAKSQAAANALVNNFGYSTSVKMMDYSPDIVAMELKNNRPVILDGATSKSEKGFWIFKTTSYGGGHAWVCDGYREVLYKTVYNQGTRYETIKTTSGGKYFHMNWGWDGVGTDSNLNNGGWFKYDNFEVKLSNGDNLNYKYRRNMIVGIKPSI